MVLIDKHDKSFNFSGLKSVHSFYYAKIEALFLGITRAWDLILLIAGDNKSITFSLTGKSYKI